MEQEYNEMDENIEVEYDSFTAYEQETSASDFVQTVNENIFSSLGLEYDSDDGLDYDVGY